MHSYNRRTVWIIVLVVMALVAFAFVVGVQGRDSEEMAPAATSDIVHLSSADHSFNSYHAGSYYFAGTKYSDARIVLVVDRTTDQASHEGLVHYVNAMVYAYNNGWAAYLPYLYYLDQRAEYPGGCFADGRGGHVSDQVGLTSMILACNGQPTGTFGQAWWAIRNGHLYGEGNAWLKGGVSAGYAFTGWCHEIGHIIQFPGHSTEKGSCMYSPLNLSDPSDEWKGYTLKDLNEFVANYGSHPIGGES